MTYLRLTVTDPNYTKLSIHGTYTLERVSYFQAVTSTMFRHWREGCPVSTELNNSDISSGRGNWSFSIIGNRDTRACGRTRVCMHVQRTYAYIRGSSPRRANSNTKGRFCTRENETVPSPSEHTIRLCRITWLLLSKWREFRVMECTGPHHTARRFITVLSSGYDFMQWWAQGNCCATYSFSLDFPKFVFLCAFIRRLIHT
jgi:hypothetical protein